MSSTRTDININIILPCLYSRVPSVSGVSAKCDIRSLFWEEWTRTRSASFSCSHSCHIILLSSHFFVRAYRILIQTLPFLSLHAANWVLLGSFDSTYQSRLWLVTHPPFLSRVFLILWEFLQSVEMPSESRVLWLFHHPVIIMQIGYGSSLPSMHMCPPSRPHNIIGPAIATCKRLPYTQRHECFSHSCSNVNRSSHLPSSSIGLSC